MWLIDREHSSSTLEVPQRGGGSYLDYKNLQDRISVFHVCIPGCKGCRLPSRAKNMVPIVGCVNLVETGLHLYTGNF